jgi:NAD(P)-dependent dehydrogenase (short-subunit alcohol dehydrogenase family)
MPFTEATVPDQTGRVVVITGANAGLGLHATRVLASKGARVVMATRNAAKTDAAAARVRRVAPKAELEHVELDLADLRSVEGAASEIRSRHGAIDVLLCNAGLMATPLEHTVDGFELQLGVNHLGHAALVARLLPVLEQADAARVVVVTSEGHRLGRIHLDDLNWDHRRYDRWLAYGRSKLANLLYVHELARRLERDGRATIAVAAHPGLARTELQSKGAGMDEAIGATMWRRVTEIAASAVGQHPARGALPLLLAATAPDVPNGSYWGPLTVLRGAPRRARPSAAARDDEVARALWERTEALTGVSHALPG